MSYYHFLIDLSISNRDFQQHAVYRRLMEQIDYLIELNQHRESKDIVGYTFFAYSVLQCKSQLTLQELREEMSRPFEFQSGSAILDAIAKSSSLMDEQFNSVLEEKNLLIFSDFEENASSYYSVKMLADHIKEFSLRKSWNFYAFGLKKSQRELFLRMNFSSENLILLPD